MADVKALTPFLQRADEMSRADPKVAYYCRMYAVEEGMRATERSSELSKLLGELLEQLETTKAAAGLAETREEDELYLENFALKLFAKADKADRAGARDARTAKLFYVSSVFIEILNQFGPVEQDVGEKQRYAAWRGAELSGCARDGRVPPRPRTTHAAAAAAAAPTRPSRRERTGLRRGRRRRRGWATRPIRASRRRPRGFRPRRITRCSAPHSARALRARAADRRRAHGSAAPAQPPAAKLQHG